MILTDVNLLVYAQREDFDQHLQYRHWHLFREFCTLSDVKVGLVTDAYLAAVLSPRASARRVAHRQSSRGWKPRKAPVDYNRKRKLGTREARMITSSPRLDDLERRYQREAFRGLSYEQALARFASLWAEARQLNPDVGKNWLEALEPDLAVARAVNGLPPAA